jgi:hypothetical protein
MAILLGIILIFILLWRNGHLNAETKRRITRFTMYLKRPVTMMMGKRKVWDYCRYDCLKLNFSMNYVNWYNKDIYIYIGDRSQLVFNEDVLS